MHTLFKAHYLLNIVQAGLTYLHNAPWKPIGSIINVGVQKTKTYKKVKK